MATEKPLFEKGDCLNIEIKYKTKTGWEDFRCFAQFLKR